MVAERGSDKIKMYVIIWEFYVKAEHLSEFEKIYREGGTWVDLFQKQNGYLGTELLRAPGDHQRYITIDRWSSSADYESFLSQWKKEYEELDRQCEGLTEQEILFGKWKVVDYEVR